MDTSWGWGEALLGKSPGGVLYFTSLVLAEDCKMLASMGSNWQCNLKKKKKKTTIYQIPHLSLKKVPSNPRNFKCAL